jgi:hypothetical protein
MSLKRSRIDYVAGRNSPEWRVYPLFSRPRIAFREFIFRINPTVGIPGAVHYRRSSHASKCTVILVSVPQRHKQGLMQGWQYKIPAMRHFLIGRLMEVQATSIGKYSFSAGLYVFRC